MTRFSLVAAVALSACASTPPPANLALTGPSESTIVASARASVAEQSKNAELAAQLEEFSAWFEGEWDNNEQVWQARGDNTLRAEKGEAQLPLHEHIHHVFARVSAPQIGTHVFFVQQYMEGDPSKIYRQRLYRLSTAPARHALQLDIHTFNNETAWRGAHSAPERFAQLAAADLRSTPGCAVYWQRDVDADRYVGSIDDGACRVKSSRSGKMLSIDDDLTLTPSEITIADVAHDTDGNLVFGPPGGVPHRNRKVRYYDGWVVIHNTMRSGSPDDRDYSMQRGLRLHSEGQRVQVLDKEGKPTGFAVELAQLTYAGGDGIAILKLGLIDEATDKTLSYTWASTDSSRIGMNLRWFQAGFTRKVKDPAIGWRD